MPQPIEMPSFIDPKEEEQNSTVELPRTLNSTLYDPELATGPAVRADKALGRLSPGYDSLLAEFTHGNEEFLRERSAEAIRQQAVETNQRKAEDSLAMLAQHPEGISFLDAQAYSDQLANVSNVPPEDPSTVFEKGWGTWLVNETLQTTGKEAMMENPDAASAVLDVVGRQTTASAINKKLEAEFAQKWSNQGWGWKGIGWTESMAPFWWMYKKEYTGEGGEQGTSTFNLKANTEEQLQHWADRALEVSPEQYESELRTYLDGRFEGDPLGALEFAGHLQTYTTTDGYLQNLFGILDVASLGAGKIAKAGLTAAARASKISPKVADLVSASKDVLRADRKRTPNLREIQAVGGKAEDAAEAMAAKKVVNDVNAAATGVPQETGNTNVLNDLTYEVPELYDPHRALGLNPGEQLNEYQRRLVEQLETQGHGLTSILDDEIRTGRLTEDQIAAGMKNSEDLFNKQYPGMNNYVLKTVPILAEDTPENLYKAGIWLGTKDAKYYKNERTAKAAAKRLIGDEGWNVHKYGDSQYYIEVQKTIDETDDALRSARIPTKYQTPRGFINMVLGRVRSAQDLISKDIMKEVTNATYGSSAFSRIVDTVATPIRKLRKRDDFIRFLEHQRDTINKSTGERGWFSNNLADFEIDWEKVNKRPPTEQERLAYFTYKQLNAFNYVGYNLSLARDKGRIGLENFAFPWKDKAQGNAVLKTAGIEGKFVKDGIEGIPYQHQANPGILILSDDVSKFKYVRGKYTSAKDIAKIMGNRDAKVIHLSDEGRRMLKDQAGFSKGLKDEWFVDYVVSPNADISPLKLKQIPFNEGGSVMHGHSYFTRQANLRPVTNKEGRIVGYDYSGDFNVAHHATEADAKAFSGALEKARQMYKETYGKALTAKMLGKRAELVDFVEKNLPWDFDRFVKQWDNAGGPLKINEPIRYSVKDKSLNEVYRIDQSIPQHLSFRDTRQSDLNLYRNGVNISHALERSDPIHSITKTGDADLPLWKEETAKLIDPLVTINRQLGDVMRGRYLEDTKFKVAERFVAEFADMLQGDIKELRRNPVATLLNPVWQKGAGVDGLKMAAARNYQRVSKNFFGLKTPLQERIQWTRNKLFESIKPVLSDKNAKIIEPYLIKPATDPTTVYRSVAFHSYLGVFNPVQIFVQAQAMTNILALEPRFGIQGLSAAMLMGPLRFSKTPEMIAAASKKAALFGMKPEEFTESWDALRRSGFWNVGGEHAYRDDMMNPKFFKGKMGTFLDKGAVFFNTTERVNRMTAWNAAYLAWRRANPATKMTDEVAKEVLHRADFLTNNMARNSKAAWQHGFGSVPTQFWNWQARMIDNFMSARMTNAERARLFLAHSMMYGVPSALGITAAGAVWPWYEDIRAGLLERGIEYDDNVFTSMVVDGIGATLFEGITGTKFNFGGRYGTNGFPVLKELYRGEKGFAEILLGASGTSLGNLYAALEPVAWSATQVFSGREDFYPVLGDSLKRFVTDNVSSFSNARKIYNALMYHEYISRNEMVTGLSPLEGVISGIMGPIPQRMEDMYLMLEKEQDIKAWKDDAQREIRKAWSRGARAFADGDYTEADSWYKTAKMWMLGHFRPDEYGAVLGKTLQGNDALESIGNSFIKDNPEALRPWMKMIQERDKAIGKY